MNQETIKLFPPTIFYTLAIASIILWILFPTPILFNVPFNLLGTIPVLFGIILNCGQIPISNGTTLRLNQMRFQVL